MLFLSFFLSFVLLSFSKVCLNTFSINGVFKLFSSGSHTIILASHIPLSLSLSLSLCVSNYQSVNKQTHTHTHTHTHAWIDFFFQSIYVALFESQSIRILSMSCKQTKQNKTKKQKQKQKKQRKKQPQKKREKARVKNDERKW